MVRQGHAEIIRSLRRKIDFELFDPKFFKEILHEAIDRGHLDCIKALLEKQNSVFQSNAVDIAKNYHSMRNRNSCKIINYLSEEFKFIGCSNISEELSGCPQNPAK
jgi:ankyrin repeat protein